MQQLAVSKLPVFLAALLGAVGGALGVRSLGSAVPPDRLQCRQLEIVGDDGTTAIRLGRTDNASAVSLFDSQGRERLRLKVTDGQEKDLAGTASVELLGSEGGVVADFAMGSQHRQHGSHVALSIYGGAIDEWKQPIPQVRLGSGTAHSLGGAGLTLYDGEHGHRLVMLEADEDTGSSLYLIGNRPAAGGGDRTADSRHTGNIFLETRSISDSGDGLPLVGVVVGGSRATLGVRPETEGGPCLELRGANGQIRVVEPER